MTAAPNLQSTRKSQTRALLVAILIIIGIGGGTGWLVTRGLNRGETWLPSKRSSRDRVVHRAQEPVMFWVAIAVYGVLCCGAVGAAGWLVREGMRATDGVAGAPLSHPGRDEAEEHRSPHPPARSETMTLDGARALIAQTPSAKERAAAEQLLNEAIALPQLAPSERPAAFARIRGYDSLAPDYQLRSFGARMLEIVGDAHADPAVKKAIYTEAAELASRYAASASSGGEGTARSMHVREIEAKRQALETRSHSLPSTPVAMSSAAAFLPPQTARPNPTSVPPVPTSARPSTPRPAFLTTLGWVFLIAGALATPISLISALMILAGGDGSSGGSFFGGLIVIAGPPATLIAGIGLLRRRPWAYGYAMLVLGVFAAHSLVQIVRGETPERTTVSPSGLITTTLGSSPSYPLHFLIIAISLSLLWKLRSRGIRAEFTR